MRNFYIFFLLASLLLIFSLSCRTFKQVNNNSNSLTASNIYDSTLTNQFDFQSLSLRFTLKYSGESKSLSLKGNMKIIKDSIIWISLSPGFGIEAVRVLCTNDSIFMLNRLNKTITKANYSYLNKMWKIQADYKSLESILTNRFFVYPNDNEKMHIVMKNFTVKNDTNSMILSRTSPDAISNIIKFKNSSFLIYSYLIQDIKNLRTLLINYKSNFSDEYPNFPSQIDITSNNKTTNLKAKLFYKKLTINSIKSYSFRVPSSYKVKIIK